MGPTYALVYIAKDKWKYDLFTYLFEKCKLAKDMLTQPQRIQQIKRITSHMKMIPILQFMVFYC
jgi:hypothetical protein